MAISSDAAVLTPIALTSPSPSSTPSIKNKFSKVIAQLSGSFLEDVDLSEFLRTARFSHAACQSDMRDRKKVKEELLPIIFDGNTDAVNKFFASQGSTFATLKLLITKARFREGYQSEKYKQFICFREWRGVSPLQAAALCGDTFLLDDLKKLIIEQNVDENQNLIEQNIDENQPLIKKNKSQLKTIREEAIRQLEEVRSRVLDQKIILEAAAAVVDTYSDAQATRDVATARLEEIQKLETFQKQMKAFRKEMEALRNQMNNLSDASKASEAPKAQQQKDAAAGPMASSAINAGPMASISLQNNDCSAGDRKTKAETKTSSESTQITHADDAEFLAPVMNLIKAYIDYLIQYPALSSSESTWPELGRLWEIVGECHKRLPHYFKQEFFDNEPFFPVPSFEFSPTRAPCRYYNGALLVLDGLGFGTLFGLYKGFALQGGGDVCHAMSWRLDDLPDLLAVTRLYELRLTGLENIIEQLKTPEIIENLDSHQSNRSPEVGAGPGL